MATTEIGATEQASRRHTRRLKRQDGAFFWLAWGSAALVVVLLLGILLSLLWESLPSIGHFGLPFLWNERWSPAKDIFGAAAPIYGTLLTSLIAMVIAVPTSFGIAMFLTEICPKSLRRPIGIAIELLAGIPSIIYGLWGFFVLAPIMQHTVQPFLINTFGDLPIIGFLFQGAPYGIGMLTAGLVLSIMILPFITSVTRDVFETVPVMLRESAYGMGMTTWEVVRRIIIPYTRLGLVGGVMLGLGRALGETMAVTFVIGNSHRIASSLLAPGTTISAAIANEFAEADGKLYTSALVELGLILFVISFTVLALAKWLIGRTESY
ncbi:phosphate transporter permease subunit PstC [Defluviimonas sp. 20V17]|uniref:Phosphate transport system permease protein n=1 Tax=Allgaiera indica TaxID=765699 RepID=A0AAN4UTP2_9RHOB|nr:phosphate ABC transporter permease subunit PstC [Allgaiera indica]KDB05519.1 phosphate transporter permease subunit PstC [Defluviimonas sp. 20V17]GHE03519.1 phosphate transport system permease protein [Allgaiera indica]SDX43358.1 phosphate ABC transporter membrane protein 1, PhoT family [Allgaiera indica]